MAEYIKRDTAIRAVMAAKWVDGSDGAMAMEIVASPPAADVVPVVHGRWEQTEAPFMNECEDCSVCGYRTVWGHRFNHCPNCGAKMDGDDSE